MRELKGGSESLSGTYTPPLQYMEELYYFGGSNAYWILSYSRNIPIDQLIRQNGRGPEKYFAGCSSVIENIQNSESFFENSSRRVG